MTYNFLWGNKIHITFTNDTDISEGNENEIPRNALGCFNVHSTEKECQTNEDAEEILFVFLQAKNVHQWMRKGLMTNSEALLNLKCLFH